MTYLVMFMLRFMNPFIQNQVFNILALAVLPQTQGKGIGKTLLEGLEQEAEKTWL